MREKDARDRKKVQKGVINVWKYSGPTLVSYTTTRKATSDFQIYTASPSDKKYGLTLPTNYTINDSRRMTLTIIEVQLFWRLPYET